uniref:Mitochondrial pyruvate carrier n=1 Tax=Romanomermis culicivorax TaxID=13658 RepID=A0A915L4F3_ROMCU
MINMPLSKLFDMWGGSLAATSCFGINGCLERTFVHGVDCIWLVAASTGCLVVVPQFNLLKMINMPLSKLLDM